MPAPVPHILVPHILRICRAEFCKSMGCEQLIEHIEKRLGAKLGETTADGSFTLEAVYCIGNCAHSPSVLLDGKPYGRVSAQVADSLIDDALRREGPRPVTEAEKQLT